MTKFFRICFVMLAVLGFCALAQAADIPWIGLGPTNDFSDPANWGAGFPGTADGGTRLIMGPYTLPDLTVVTTYTADILPGLPPAIGQLLIGNGGDVTLNNSGFHVTANSWMVIGWNGGAGTLNLSGTATLTHNNDGNILIGENAVGTLNVSGSTIVNNNNGDIIVGVGATGNGTLTISDNVRINNNRYWTIIGRDGGTGHVTQTGGTVTTSSAYDGVIQIGEGGSTGEWTMTGGIIECGGGRISIGAGGSGSMTITGNSSIHLSRGEFWVGSGSAATGSLTIGDGTDNPTITIDNNWMAVGRDGGNGSVTFNSGTITKTGNGDLSLGGWWLNGANGTLWTQNGGALNIASDIRCGENGNAVFKLNGGSVKANMIYRMGSGVSEFYFNGGTVELTGAGTMNVGTNYVEPGGANITLQKDVTFSTGLQAGLTGSGGVTKSGPGNMILIGTPDPAVGNLPVNTYTGLTHVTEGGLVLRSNAVLFSDVTVDSTATQLAGVGYIGIDITGTGTSGGNVTLGNGVTLHPGDAGAIGTLQIASSLALDANKLNINVGAGVASAVWVQEPVMGTYGTLSATGTTVVTPIPLASASVGPLEIIQYNATGSSVNLSNFVLALDTVGALDASLQITDHSGVYSSLDLVLAASTNEWIGPDGGNYNVAANWHDGTVPNAAGAKAAFGQAYGQTGGTVMLNVDATIGKLVFDNLNTYTIRTNTGNKFTFVPQVLNAAINNVNGSHEIAVNMETTKPLVVTVANSIDTLTLSGAISESGGAQSVTANVTGSLALAGANSYTGATIVNGVTGGKLIVTNLAPAGSASSIGAATADAANFQIGNTMLSYTGGTTATNRGITVTGPLELNVQNATPATLTLSGNIVNATSSLTTTGNGTLQFTNPAAVTLAGGGMLVSTGAVLFDGGAAAIYNANGSFTTTDWNIGLCAGYNGTTAALTLKSGTLVVPNSNFGVGYGVGSTGTLTVSGGTLNVPSNELFIGNNGGIGTLVQTGGTINVGSWVGIGRHWEPNVGNGTTGTYEMSGGVLNKTGGGDMEVGERGLLSLNNDDGELVGDQGYGYLNMSNNANINIINGWFNIATSNGANGKVTIKDSALLFVRDGNIIVGKNGGKGELGLSSGTITSNEIWVANYFANPVSGRVPSTGLFNMDGGTVNQRGWFVVGRDRGIGTFNMNAGVLDKNHKPNPTDNTWGNLIVGSNGGVGTFNMNGGIVYNNAQLVLGENNGTDLGGGTFNLNGGTVQASAVRYYQNTATSVLNFNGGVLQVSDNTGNGDYNWNGAPNPIWMHSRYLTTGTAAVQAGGAKIDTNGYTIGINQALISGAATDGGLTKQGSGALYLAATPSYNGGTNVSNGSLVLDRSSLPGPVSVAAGATLRLSNPSGLTGYYFNGDPPNPPITTGGLADVPLSAVNAVLGSVPPNAVENSRTAGSFFDFGNGGQYFPAPYNTAFEHFTTVWTGTFHAAVEGTYNFATASDDGSMLWLDNVETAVVNNNEWQGVTRRTGSVVLTAGDHPITIAYYQGGGGYGMWAEVQQPGQAWQYIANDMLSSGDPLAAQAFSIGSLSGAGTVDLGGALNTLTVNQTVNGTLSGSLIGDGSLIKSGPATLMLTGPVSYTGATTVTDGTLVLNNGLTTTLTTVEGLGTLTVAAGSNLNATSINVSTLNIGGAVAAVPEPGTLVMLALAGLAVVGVYLRRKS